MYIVYIVIDWTVLLSLLVFSIDNTHHNKSWETADF